MCRVIRFPRLLEFAGYLLGELGPALIEHRLEGLQARREHFLDRLATVVEGGDQGFGVFAEVVGDHVAAAGDRVGYARAGLLELRNHVAAAQRKVEDEGVAGRAQCRVDLFAARSNRFRKAVAGVRDGVGQLLGAGRH